MAVRGKQEIVCVCVCVCVCVYVYIYATVGPNCVANQIKWQERDMQCELQIHRMTQKPSIQENAKLNRTDIGVSHYSGSTINVA